jgi:hypothetical protein
MTITLDKMVGIQHRPEGLALRANSALLAERRDFCRQFLKYLN